MEDMDDWKISVIPGAKELIEWFGYWPSFHDAEIVEVHLSRSGESKLAIHTFEANLVENRYEFDKHVIVVFKFTEIQELALDCFNHQNVIFSLEIQQMDGSMRIDLEPCFGLWGMIRAKSVAIDLTPGKPSNTIY